MFKPNVAPTQEEIEKRAYELYLARGRKMGTEMEDWLVAGIEVTLEKYLAEASADQRRNPTTGGFSAD